MFVGIKKMDETVKFEKIGEKVRNDKLRRNLKGITTKKHFFKEFFTRIWLKLLY